MLQPETHLDIVRQRHSDLLRQARAGELGRTPGGRPEGRAALVPVSPALRPQAAPATSS